MSQPILYNLTNDTVTVFIKGEPISVTKGAPNYAALRKAVIDEDWDEVPKHLTVAQAVENWAAKASTPAAPAPKPPCPDCDYEEGEGQCDCGEVPVESKAERNVVNAPVSSGATEPTKPVVALAHPAASMAAAVATTSKPAHSFTAPAPAAPTPQGGTVEVKGDFVLYNGEPLPKKLNDRILKAVAKGEDANGLLNFWKRLKRNLNKRSIDQLWDFLAHCGIPVQPDGTFLAYKGVRMNFRDAYSGNFDNSPGKTVKMDRNKISTDPAQTCHTGLHVGALSYARSFSAQTLIVRVDPEHVCCVPNDHNAMKMRVCEYTVMGIYGAQMPDTAYDAQAESAVVVAPAKAVYTTEDLAYSREADAVNDIAVSMSSADPDDAPPKVEEQSIPITGTPWDDFNPMSIAELAAQTIADLRGYARYNCLITGASKLPGGKDTLVAKIIATRDGATTPTSSPPLDPVVVPEVLVHPGAVTPGVEETKPLGLNEQPAVKVPLTGTDWDALNKMDSVTLMEQSLDDLRKYATYNCLIVGASKIPGGKFAIVTRICQVRGDE